MRRLLFVLLLLCCSYSSWAQKLEVDSCYIDYSDSTAITSPVVDLQRKDQFCALLRVQLEFAEATFVGPGFNFVVDVTRVNDEEYLVYMSHNSSMVTVNVPGYLPVEVDFRNYGIDCLEGLKTYRLVLGQKVTVARCDPMLSDISARTLSGKRQDPDDPSKYCALVKVQLVADNATFLGDVVGPVEYENSEYHVYMKEGSTKLSIHVPGYLPCEIDFQRYLESENLEGQKVYKIVLEAQPLVKPKKYQELIVAVSPKNAKLVIDSDSISLVSGIATRTLEEGRHTYNASAPGYDSYGTTFNVEGPQDTLRINLAKTKVVTVVDSMSIDMSFYLGANFQVGSLSGIGASVGAYISNFNVQLDVLMGLTASEPIYWNGLSTDPYSYTYKPLYLGVKLGYGIKVGESFRFTPQVGIGVSKITGTVDHKGQGSDPEVKAMSAVPLSVGLRAEWLIAKHFGICVAPEYDIAMQKGKPYEAVSAVSSDVKGFGEGFNLKAGLFLIF